MQINNLQIGHSVGDASLKVFSGLQPETLYPIT